MTAFDQAPLFVDESQFSSGSELLVPKAEQAHRFTGELVARNEAKYLAIVRALGLGLGRRQFARAFGVSHHTVQAIFEREPAMVATEKESTGRQLRRVVRMSLDATEEALEKGEIPKGSLPVTTAILIDKSLNWDGQATHTVTVRHEWDQEKLRASFRALEQPAIEAELVTPESVSGGIEAKPLQIWQIGEGVVADVVGCAAPTTATATLAPSGFDLAPPSTITTTTTAPTSVPEAESGGGGDQFQGAAPKSQ
jgi:hypothetical protein